MSLRQTAAQFPQYSEKQNLAKERHQYDLASLRRELTRKLSQPLCCSRTHILREYAAAQTTQTAVFGLEVTRTAITHRLYHGML
ncbi:hypothetical protein WJX74_001496 [Apatococcus lobatus]|uniref:Uncharacterized protein n=2 Tax=Apatococcus TaxID=904362 RepID=A0AAW1T4G0_9CHLO